MKIKIDFFNKNIIDAIGAGIYQVSIMNKWKRRSFIYWRIRVCACALRGAFI